MNEILKSELDLNAQASLVFTTMDNIVSDTIMMDDNHTIAVVDTSFAESRTIEIEDELVFKEESLFDDKCVATEPQEVRIITPTPTTALQGLAAFKNSVAFKNSAVSLVKLDWRMDGFLPFISYLKLTDGAANLQMTIAIPTCFMEVCIMVDNSTCIAQLKVDITTFVMLVSLPPVRVQDTKKAVECVS